MLKPYLALNPGNYYGRLWLKKEGSKYFWSVYDVVSTDWEEISENLARQLVLHYERCKKEQFTGWSEDGSR